MHYNQQSFSLHFYVIACHQSHPELAFHVYRTCNKVYDGDNLDEKVLAGNLVDEMVVAESLEVASTILAVESPSFVLFN